MRQPTCEQRIDAKLESTIETLTEMWEIYTGRREPAEDVTEDSFGEYGLAFDYVEPDTFDNQPEGYFRYQLSWGGPSSEFRFFVSPSARGFVPYRIEYRFLDWFDGATRELGRGTLEYELLAEVFDWFKECGAAEVAE